MLPASIKQLITSTYAEYGENEVELEARFGSYKNRRFKSGVNIEVFNRIKSYFDTKSQSIQTRTTDYISNDVRKTVTIPTDEEEIDTVWIKKNRLWNQEDPNYNIRYSMSRETPISPIYNFKPDILREKNRYSYIVFRNTVRVDMTIVNMIKLTDDKSAKSTDYGTTYEVEIELLSSGNLSFFEKTIVVTLQQILDTVTLYDNKVANSVISFVNSILQADYRGNISHYPIVQARNLKLKDMVWGGLIGNEKTGYSVTHKADGQRKLLVFHNTGIWLVSPPHNLNRLTNTQVPALIGTILDGELVPLNKRKEGAPDTRIWFLAFDCLSWNSDNNIQNKPHGVRMNHAKAVAENFKTPLLQIDTKSFVNFGTPQEFFSTMRDMFREQPHLTYDQDGFMFTPVNEIYNPHSNKHKLSTRVLTRYPDICKWKPIEELTIDFQIKWKIFPDGTKYISLYSNEKGKPVLFKGTTIAPFENMIDHYHPLTLDLPNNTIVEYGWDYDENLFVPKRVRHDKIKPNTIDIAEDVWSDIQKPLDKETMIGQTLTLMRRYHNRIKTNLIQSVFKLNPNKKDLTLLDIGSGRGGDVAKWRKFSKIVAVEPNPEHIVELKKRLDTYQLTDRVRIVNAGGQDIELINKHVKEFIGDRVDVVSMMLSMSFFWQNQSMVHRLVNTITSNIKPDGNIIFLTIDGDLVEQTFEPAMDTGPALTKLELTQATLIYKGDRIPKELDIHIEGTIVEDQTEWLVRIADLILPLRKFGFGFIERERADKEKFLTEEEITLTQMYTYATIGKDPNIKNITPLPELLQVLPGKEEQPGLKTDPNEIPVFTLEKIKPVKMETPILFETPLEKQLEQPVALLPEIPVLPGVLSGGLPMTGLPVTGLPVTGLPMMGSEGIKSPVADMPPIPKIVVPETKLPQLKITKDLPPMPRIDIEHELSIIPIDTYEKINIKWYPNENVVRIGTIGDGSCFFHAVLGAYYQPYQNNDQYKFRSDLVKRLRRDLAYILQLKDPQRPDKTIWETAVDGQFMELYNQQMMGLDFTSVFGVPIDFSLEGLQKLFNSMDYLGNEVYQYASDLLGIDIYIMRGTNKNLYPYQNTSKEFINRKAVVITGNGCHYEIIAIERNGLFQTVFERDDPFIIALKQWATKKE